MFDSIKNFLPTIHKEGYIFIVIFTFVTLVAFAMDNRLGWLGVVLTLWCVYFFRDPERVTPIAHDIVVSPADGVIQRIAKAFPPKELEMPDEEMMRISVFLNVFDVHVNRIAVEGIIEKTHYHPGKFLNASLDKASEDNERQSLLIKTPKGEKVALVQIAGLIARRIVCDAKEGQEAKLGQRFGIIRFGSRVDVYLPLHVTIMVAEGQKAIAGETILANMNGDLDYKIEKWEIR